MQQTIKVFVVTAGLLAASLAAQEQTPPQSTTPQQPPQTEQPTRPQAQPPETQQPPAQQPPAGPPPVETTPPPAPAPAAPSTEPVTPEQIGLQLTPPQGWNQGDPKAFTVPGQICCAWSPDNVASVVVFVQKTGQALNPRALLDQSAEALKTGVGAQVQAAELRDIGGKRAFWLVVSAAGNGAAIDGKGTVPTTQHWVAIPRQDDIVIFLMTSPTATFPTHETAFEQMLQTLQVGGTQTAQQQAAT